MAIREEVTDPGELWENGDRLDFHRFDESALVFIDPADADTISWIPPRTPKP